MNIPDVEDLYSLEMDANPSPRIALAKDIIVPLITRIISMNDTSQSNGLVEGDDLMVKPASFQQ